MTAAAARHGGCPDGKRLSAATGLPVRVRLLNPIQQHREQLVVALMQPDGAAPTARNDRIRRACRADSAQQGIDQGAVHGDSVHHVAAA
ncbi:hypothetical protein GCM10010206_65930 [Streptomyces cinerochromogenes]|nr:hypothetical protein GCM10010206_65930 [Streptomyces cinerochromogenes]